jgi:hypothetical protein
MLPIYHQVGILLAINGLTIASLIKSRRDYKRIAVMVAGMAVVCFNMEAIDRQRWFTTPVLILGLCVPFILYIGTSVMLMYLQVVSRMKLLDRLRKKLS